MRLYEFMTEVDIRLDDDMATRIAVFRCTAAAGAKGKQGKLPTVQCIACVQADVLGNAAVVGAEQYSLWQEGCYTCTYLSP